MALPPHVKRLAEKAFSTLQEETALLRKVNDLDAWAKTPPPLTKTLLAWPGTPLAIHCVTVLVSITTSPALKIDMPPPKLYACATDAPQPVRTEQRENTELEIVTFASSAEINTAPPAALKAPKLQDDELLSVKLQYEIFKCEDCADDK